MAGAWPQRLRIGQTDAVAGIRGLASGIAGGLVASLCCLPPAVALALGFGGSAFLVSLGAHQTEFRAAGFGLTALAAWWTLRRRARACRTRRGRVPFLLLAVGTLVVSYLALTYVVTPFLYDVYARR